MPYMPGACPYERAPQMTEQGSPGREPVDPAVSVEAIWETRPADDRDDRLAKLIFGPRADEEAEQ